MGPHFYFCYRNVFWAFLLAVLASPFPALSFTVPDTGVTTCYDDTGAEIVCPEPGQPFYGQDAHYGPGTLSLTDNGDGTVSDMDTNLMWEAKDTSNGLPSADPNDPDNTYSWNELAGFINQINTNNYAGYSDWRLPTVKEIETIVDLSVAEPGPTVLTSFFPNCRSGSYWTSESDIDNPSQAWALDFSTSYDNISVTTSKLFVRAVRGGM